MAAMDMDMAWCLTCSKKTESNRPYCSDKCRNADTAGQAAFSNQSIFITSSIPISHMISPPRPNNNAPTISPTKSTSAFRPSPSPLIAANPPASVSLAFPGTTFSGPRDRRAFSFPTTHAPAPVAFAERRLARQSQAALTPFNKKPHALSNAFTPPETYTNKDASLRPPAFAKVSKSTGGANTPLDPDSVFCSTSESSDNEPEQQAKTKPVPSLSFHRKPSKTSQTKPRLSPPDADPLGSLRSKLSGATTTLGPRKSQSPVAALVASSASSRSREDIISWARAVGYRPRQFDGTLSDDEEEEEDAGEGADEERGRSRTRRDGLGMKGEKKEVPLDSPEEGIMGTTPKGRIGSALAGFRGFGVGPIVKALTSVTGSKEVIPSSAPIHPPITKTLSRKNTGEIVTVGLGLQAVAPRTEVSRVAVVASTNNAIPSDTEPPLQHYYSGATPTLSTISLSEVVDMSVADHPDHVDMMNCTDDQYSTTSYNHPSSRLRARRESAAQHLAKAKQQVNTSDSLVPSLAARPIATIWNISNYLRSFSPFANTTIPTYPTIPTPTSDVSAKGSPVPFGSKTGTPSRSSPLPTSRTRPVKEGDSEETSPKVEMVRSLPMDIIIPGSKTGVPPTREAVYQPHSPVRGSRSRVRSRDREESRRPRARPGSSSPFGFDDDDGLDDEGDGTKGRGHGRKWSYDADADGDGEESEDEVRRGRSRRGKGLPVLEESKGEGEGLGLKLGEELSGGDADEEEEVERGRGRGRGRGRERVVRAVV